MAWERGYYYRVRKVNGRVVREYVGTGRVAELAAELDSIKRENRQTERALRQAERANLDAINGEVETLIHLTDLATAAAMRAAGFHLHKGQWRRKRHGKNDHSE